MHTIGEKIVAFLNPTGIEPSAMAQLENVSKLPFIFHHIAVMPDCHLGIGATVGSVIATRGAIVPAAVGVDIGCFAGDTLIPLLGGRSVPIRHLAESGLEYCVYSCSIKGRIYAARATAKQTRRAELVRVTLDSGRTIDCTPDHEFLLCSGDYRRADSLMLGDSLMPLYREQDDGYALIQQPYSGRMQREHWMVARSGLLGSIPSFPEQRTVIHHRDFDGANNDPSNLEFMGDADHSAYHCGLVDRNTHWQSPEFETRRKAALAAKAQTPEGRAYFAERGTANLLAYMAGQPEHFAESVSGNGARGRAYLVRYNQSEKGRTKSAEIASRFYPCGVCSEQVRSGLGVHNHRRWKHGVNHVVVSVRPLSEKADVYCLTVPDRGNFALDAGVFVHNCGMIAVKTKFTSEHLPDNLKETRDGIERRIPTGFGVNQKIHPSADRRMKELAELDPEGRYIKVDIRWPQALGSLGGGNHFIEICLDEADQVWAVLHSGSRGIGNKLAQKHMNAAKGLMEKWFISLPDPALAYLIEGTPEFDEYIRDLLWAQQFALLNREEMMDRVMTELSYLFFKEGGHEGEIEQERIQCHHNFTQKEHHMGADVWITRKGAIQMRKGQRGIIPGSMGTKSYIVSGLENPVAFHSAPHGAGRRFSRTEARRRFTMEDFKAMVGIECRKSEALIDELPGAYKPIDEVMENSKDLVKIDHELRQALNVKGD